MSSLPKDAPPEGLALVAEREAALLAPYAFFSHQSAGRKYPESEHAYRSPFQRDRDRIVHSAGFRRLSGKMQVFTDRGDYHRTRLTHTMEVASIARTFARALRLNEDLVEALALLHDIGHPPFGHAGEDALSECLEDDGGFSHNRFALTLVEELEQRHSEFPGLNLSREVLLGQADRVDKSDPNRSRLLEVQIVDLADSMTYNAHDVDDAVKLGLVGYEDLNDVPLVRRAMEHAGFRDARPSRRRSAVVYSLLRLQVDDVLLKTGRELANSSWTSSDQVMAEGYVIGPDGELADQKKELERFLHQRVYRHQELMAVRQIAQQQLRELHAFFVGNADRMPSLFHERAGQVGPARAAADYIAGMTDRFCRKSYQEFVAGRP